MWKVIAGASAAAALTIVVVASVRDDRPGQFATIVAPLPERRAEPCGDAAASAATCGDPEHEDGDGRPTFRHLCRRGERRERERKRQRERDLDDDHVERDLRHGRRGRRRRAPDVSSPPPRSWPRRRRRRRPSTRRATRARGAMRARRAATKIRARAKRARPTPATAEPRRLRPVGAAVDERGRGPVHHAGSLLGRERVRLEPRCGRGTLHHRSTAVGGERVHVEPQRRRGPVHHRVEHPGVRRLAVLAVGPERAAAVSRLQCSVSAHGLSQKPLSLAPSMTTRISGGSAFFEKWPLKRYTLIEPLFGFHVSA